MLKKNSKWKKNQFNQLILYIKCLQFLQDFYNRCTNLLTTDHFIFTYLSCHFTTIFPNPIQNYREPSAAVHWAIYWPRSISSKVENQRGKRTRGLRYDIGTRITSCNLEPSAYIYRQIGWWYAITYLNPPIIAPSRSRAWCYYCLALRCKNSDVPRRPFTRRNPAYISWIYSDLRSARCVCLVSNAPGL